MEQTLHFTVINQMFKGNLWFVVFFVKFYDITV